MDASDETTLRNGFFALAQQLKIVWDERHLKESEDRVLHHLFELKDPWLLILDNVKPNVEFAKGLSKRLAGHPKVTSVIIATSQFESWPDLEEPWEAILLEQLGNQEAVKLLQERVRKEYKDSPWHAIWLATANCFIRPYSSRRSWRVMPSGRKWRASCHCSPSGSIGIRQNPASAWQYMSARQLSKYSGPRPHRCPLCPRQGSIPTVRSSTTSGLATLKRKCAKLFRSSNDSWSRSMVSGSLSTSSPSVLVIKPRLG